MRANAGSLRTSRRIAREHPDLVVMSNRISVAAEGHSDDDSAAAYERRLRARAARWEQARVPVLALHDTPAPGDGGKVDSVPDCVAEHLDDLAACSGPREDWEPDDPVVDAVAALGQPCGRCGRPQRPDLRVRTGATPWSVARSSTSTRPT